MLIIFTNYNGQDKSGSVKAPTLFSSYPIPREYQPNIAGRSAMKQGECIIRIAELKCIHLI